MKVTAQEEYGLRCLMQVALASASGKALTTNDIAEAEGLGTPFVGKIVNTLKAAGLVKTAPGTRSGIVLSRPASAIMLDEVLTVLGGRLFSGAYCDEHTGKRGDCVHSLDCQIRPVWGSLELIVSAMLKRISVAELLGSEEAIRSTFTRSAQDALKTTAEQVEVSGVAGRR